MRLKAIISVDSSQTSTTVLESKDMKVGCLDQHLQLSIHRQGWIQMNAEDFDFVSYLHATIANVRGDWLQPGKTLS